MVCVVGNVDGGYGYFIKSTYEKFKQRMGKLEEEVELIGVKIKRFRDGEIKVKIEKSVREKSCFFIPDCSLTPSEWFLQLALINHALKNSSAAKIIDVIPYHYFARQDRKDESRVAINARVVADVVSLYADRVVTCDLHSPQIQGFYSIPVDNLYSFPYAIDQIVKHEDIEKDMENLVVMSPDTGGAKRAEAFLKRLAKKFNKEDWMELVIGYKTRPREGEIGKYRLIGNVEGKNVLIVDDMVDSGGTLVEAEKALRAAGAKKVFAYATHGLFTEGYAKFKLDRIFVSNTRPQDSKKVEVIDLTDLFAEAMFRIYKKQSLSNLFE
jgi:ribose-phosphate pyrophosphokinase